MKRRSGSDVLLAKAKADEEVLDAALAGAKISDEVFGFHAQQAVEKLLKARLTCLAVDYPKVHNLLTMVELLGAAGESLPDDLGELFRLTPFATTFRYEEVEELTLPESHDGARRTPRWGRADNIARGPDHDRDSGATRSTHTPLA